MSMNKLFATFAILNALPLSVYAEVTPAGHYDCTVNSITSTTNHSIEALQIRNGVGKTFEVLLYDESEGNLNRYMTLLGHEASSQNFYSDGSGSQETKVFRFFANGSLYTVNFNGENSGSIDFGFYDELATFICSKS